LKSRFRNLFSKPNLLRVVYHSSAYISFTSLKAIMEKIERKGVINEK